MEFSWGPPGILGKNNSVPKYCFTAFQGCPVLFFENSSLYLEIKKNKIK